MTNQREISCAIMQPTYLPWCGYFNLISSVDNFIFLDDVKLEKSDWHIRNRIKSANGQLMMSICVNLPNGRMKTMLNQATLDLSKPWQKKHLKSIYSSYRKAKYFDEVYPFIEALINNEYSNLSQYTVSIIKAISQKLGIKTHFVLASELVKTDKVKDHRLVELCQQLQVSHYLSPVGSSAYLEKNTPGGAIVEHNIQLSYQDFKHPIYNQLYGDFISHLSIVDMLFNCGFEQSAELIRNT
ncbi:MAG: WbqC family protein [Colwelliaceae bacterium]|nr:WbqC family protein [Colwelliaceae bacterium]